MKEEKVERNHTCLLSCPTRCVLREVSPFYLLWVRDFPGLQGSTVVVSLQLCRCNGPRNVIGLHNQTIYSIYYPQYFTTGALWINKLGKSDHSKNYVKQQWNKSRKKKFVLISFSSEEHTEAAYIIFSFKGWIWKGTESLDLSDRKNELLGV